MTFKLQEFADGHTEVSVTYNDKDWILNGIFDDYAAAKRYVMIQLPPDTIVRTETISL